MKNGKKTKEYTDCITRQSSRLVTLAADFVVRSKMKG